MTDSNFMFNRPYKPFGFNIKVPERTIQQAGDSIRKIRKLETTKKKISTHYRAQT